MNIKQTVGLVTGAIPIVGLLVGGITFGVNFKTDVENVKTEVANQKTVNTSMEERFAAIPLRYDDTNVWNAIDNLYIPEEYDDAFITDRLQELDVNLVELRTRLEGIDFGGEEYDDSYIRSRIADLDGSLNALANIEMDSNGDVDISSLVMQIASVEGAVQGIKNTLGSIQSQINTVERSSSRPAQSYDDSSLRASIRTVTSDISDIERRLNSVGSSSGSSSTTRVENPYDDSSIRNDLRNLRSDIQALQRDRGTTYDDTSLKNSIRTLQNDISTLQGKITSISNQPIKDARVDSLVKDLQSIKNNVEGRIKDVEKALATTQTDTTSDHRFNEFEDMLREEFHWTMEQFYFEINDLRNQVYSLQETVDFLGNNTTSSNNTTSNNYSTTEPPYWLKVAHKESSYTGDYYFDGYFDGHPMWVNWECGKPGSKYEYCYIFKYNGVSWVIQPLAPSTEWLANAYTDAKWPWKGKWNGDVKDVVVME